MPIGIAQKTPGSVVVSDAIAEIRLIKSEYEIGRTVHACPVVELGHETLLGMCKPGLPEGAIFSTLGSTINKKIFEDIPLANFIVTKAMGAVGPPISP